ASGVGPQQSIRVLADAQCSKLAECLGERWCGRGVSLRQPDHPRVEQDVSQPRRIGTGGGGPRCPRSRQPAQILPGLRPHRDLDRPEVDLAYRRGVEWVKAPGSVEKQAGSVEVASLVDRDLAAQAPSPGGRPHVERPGFGRGYEREGLIERSRVALSTGRREDPPRTR